MSETISSRPLANFHSTVWGYRFLPYTLELTEISNLEKLELEELNGKVKKMLVDTPGDCPEKLVLIDTIQRLGVAYHFNNEIETSIQNIFNVSQQDSEIDDDNLYVVALRFRLLRQQGHYISSDVFKQFTNKDGKFKESLANDVKGLLSMYEAAHLRVRDEEILEEALTFTTAHLESMDVPNLSNSLKVQVSEALRQPIRKTLTRLGARKNISIYENTEGHNDLILKFAKLDFNALQKLHQRELSELTRWWKDLDFANKLPYARDRLVECYFWIVGVYFEPKYSRARRMLTKVINMTSITDDTFDAYAIFKELVPFTDAIQRWDISSIDSLEPYMRPVYQALLDVYNEMEAELAKECKSDRVYYAKHEMKKLVRAYFKEAEWLNARETPNCAEYMKNALVSCGYMMLATTSLVGMEESITKETFEWIINEPLIVRASSVINRLMDDIIGHEVEQERGHVASVIECYMKEHGISKQEVQIEIQKQVRNAWKDINKEFLEATEAPMFVLERVLNLARVMDTIYKEVDGYTNSKGKLKDMINLLFVESVKV